MFKTQYLLGAVVAVSVAGGASAALVWTGAGDGVSLYQEANWLDDNGDVPAAGTIDNTGPVTAATGGLIEINSGTGSPNNFSGNFSVGVGNDLAVGGGKTLATATNGINIGGAVVSNQNLTITGGSTVRATFIVDFDVTLDGGSTLRFNGAGNPVNGSTINVLDLDSVIRFDNEDFAAFAAEHQSKTTLQGNALVFGSDAFVVEAGDNAVAADFNNGDGVEITFVPEPTSLALMALGGLCVLRRRR